jgi:hypothetical protein
MTASSVAAKYKRPAGFPAGLCVKQRNLVSIRLRADSYRAVRGTVMVDVVRVVDERHCC